MGGMGFIQSNHSVIFYNNVMISFNMMEACRVEGVTASSTPPPRASTRRARSSPRSSPAGLKEAERVAGAAAGRVRPREARERGGVQALPADFGIQTRIARFHNIYGPFGTWKGGREKAPAAFCRKAATATTEVEMWGDGKQTRSFTYIDDCVEGIFRLTKSDFAEPVNLGSDEMVTMNEMQALALGFAGKPDMAVKHIPGPEGVRGRNSNNELIKEKLGYAPSVKLADGLAGYVRVDRGEDRRRRWQGGANAEEAFSQVHHLRHDGAHRARRPPRRRRG